MVKYTALALSLTLAAAFVRQWIAGAICVLVALRWLVPDRRIGRALSEPRE